MIGVTCGKDVFPVLFFDIKMMIAVIKNIIMVIFVKIIMVIILVFLRYTRL